MADTDEWLRVESLDLDGRGVAHDAAGKVLFVEGALPGECVQVDVGRRKAHWEQGTMRALIHESAQRVRPGCVHFGLHRGACGGCKVQHLHVAAQVAVKQRVLEDNLWHLAKVRPECMLRAIQGPAWGYRYRARLAVRDVPKKAGVLVGFHERKSSHVADMQGCPVLPPHASALLLPLRRLVSRMRARSRVPQIELAIGDEVTALVLRHLDPLCDEDLQSMREFGAEFAVQWWLQPAGPESIVLLEPSARDLAYDLPEFGLRMPFRPTDFTQVNPWINQALVGRAVRCLDLHRDERVIDWFCGLGNFSLALATRAEAVLGVEGSPALVTRARDNALANGLGDRVDFEVRDLFEIGPSDVGGCGAADKWLIDPPREGAFALVKALVDLNATLPPGWVGPARIVYVSCNPATLARDAGLLVHQAGYRCVAAGVVNMFSHTAHVESLAVFAR